LLRRRNRNNPTLQAAIILYFRVFVVLVAVLVAVGVAGYGRILSDSALIISAVALAIGVAAQEVIGSIVSGIALVLDPEFNVGDYIEWPEGEGIVQSIALRVTRVETPDGELVTIPNTILTGNELVRPYGRGNHRIIQKIGLAYDDDVDEALAHLEDVAASMDMILAEPAPTAYVDELADDAVVVRIHYWIEDPNRRDIFAARSAYASAIKRRLESVGITISPPSERDLQGRIGIDGPV
jgi:small-conductance mechanosensitive channel